MSEQIKPGDRVRFRAGRGYAVGTVANVAAGKVLINTAKGKSLTRKLSQLSLVVEESSTPATSAAPAVAATAEVDGHPTAVAFHEQADA